MVAVNRPLNAGGGISLLVSAFAMLPSPHARAEVPLPKVLPFPTENKDFPSDESLFVPFYATDGMIKKGMDLNVSVTSEEKGEFTVGLIGPKGETLVKKNARFTKDEPVSLAKLSILPQAGWQIAAFRDPKKEILATRMASGKADLIHTFWIDPGQSEASTQFTVHYILTTDCRTICTAQQMDAPFKVIEVQKKMACKHETEYKPSWDATGETPGRYGIHLFATDESDDTVFDQSDGWRQVKK